MYGALYTPVFSGLNPEGSGTANTSTYCVLSHREQIRDSYTVKAEVLFLWVHTFVCNVNCVIDFLIIILFFFVTNSALYTHI